MSTLTSNQITENVVEVLNTLKHYQVLSVHENQTGWCTIKLSNNDDEKNIEILNCFKNIKGIYHSTLQIRVKNFGKDKDGNESKCYLVEFQKEMRYVDVSNLEIVSPICNFIYVCKENNIETVNDFISFMFRKIYEMNLYINHIDSKRDKSLRSQYFKLKRRFMKYIFENNYYDNAYIAVSTESISKYVLELDGLCLTASQGKEYVFGDYVLPVAIKNIEIPETYDLKKNFEFYINLVSNIGSFKIFFKRFELRTR